jgi:hypothetical protein
MYFAAILLAAIGEGREAGEASVATYRLLFGRQGFL